MNHKIFSIFDSAAQAYFPPFFLHQEKMAIRGFEDAVNNPESAISLHPKDYTLFQIGDFDDSKGTITPLQVNKPLGNGLSFVQTKVDVDQLQLLEDIQK